MEVKIYDKDGNVIAVDKNNEGNEFPGHYDIDLSDKKTGIQFVKNKSGKISRKKNFQ